MAPAPYGSSMRRHYYSPVREVYSGSMSDQEDIVLKGTMRDLGEASRRVRAARHLMREHALEDDPRYLPLVARLSEALDVTEAALRKACRLRDTT
jgi:hypothetical protein